MCSEICTPWIKPKYLRDELIRTESKSVEHERNFNSFVCWRRCRPGHERAILKLFFTVNVLVKGIDGESLKPSAKYLNNVKIRLSHVWGVVVNQLVFTPKLPLDQWLKLSTKATFCCDVKRPMARLVNITNRKKHQLNCYSRHRKSLNTINKRVTCGSFTKHEENVLVGTKRRYK